MTTIWSCELHTGNARRANCAPSRGVFGEGQRHRVVRWQRRRRLQSPLRQVIERGLRLMQVTDCQRSLGHRKRTEYQGYRFSRHVRASAQSSRDWRHEARARPAFQVRTKAAFVRPKWTVSMCDLEFSLCSPRDARARRVTLQLRPRPRLQTKN